MCLACKQSCVIITRGSPGTWLRQIYIILKDRRVWRPSQWATHKWVKSFNSLNAVVTQVQLLQQNQTLEILNLHQTIALQRIHTVQQRHCNQSLAAVVICTELSTETQKLCILRTSWNQIKKSNESDFVYHSLLVSLVDVGPNLQQAMYMAQLGIVELCDYARA